MLLNRRTPVFRHTIWCLLSLWLCFGSLELAEQVHLIPETTAEDQGEQDLDQEALSQLASGLKPDVPSLSAPCCASGTAEVAEAALSLSWKTLNQLRRLMLQDPPSLRLTNSFRSI